MAVSINRKAEPQTVRGLCVICKEKPQKSNGVGIFKPMCTICHKRAYDRSHRQKLDDCCETCGFVPAHACQLDIDHRDGDHTNNSPENLATLCANCHRLKTYINKDWEKKTPD